MELLLDTHVFLWWHSSHPRLPRHVREEIEDRDNGVHVSAASVWEIAIKRRGGSIDFEGSPADALVEVGFVTLACDGMDAEAAGGLDWDHADPFDRMIVAQALRRRLVLVSADRRILNFGPVAILAAN